MSTGPSPIVVTVGQWRATWSPTGSGADVEHLEHPGAAVAFLNLWDHEAGALRVERTADALTAALSEWVEAEGDDYRRELPYL